jgi:hypothetical protein
MLGNFIGDVVNGYDAIEDCDENKYQQRKRTIVQKRIKVQMPHRKKKQAEQNDCGERDTGGQPLAQPEPSVA